MSNITIAHDNEYIVNIKVVGIGGGGGDRIVSLRAAAH